MASCLVVSGHASTQTCAQGSTGLHVWWSLLALSHSCFTHVWHHPLGCLSRQFIVNLGSLSALSDLHLLGLLILLLLLDHRNLSPHAPGDLGNLIDDLHYFLQFGCSEHLRLHLRIFRACVWLLDLFLLHNWTSTILSVNFRSSLCLLRRWHLHQDSGIPVKELNMTLPHLSARYALGELARFCDVPQQAHQRTCHCAVLVHLRRFSAPSALTSACSRRCRELCR